MADSHPKSLHTRDSYRTLWKNSLLKVKALLSDQTNGQFLSQDGSPPRFRSPDQGWKISINEVNNFRHNDDWRQKRIKLITKLLDEYDQEKTEEKYRSLNKVTYVVNPASYSVYCEMSGDKVRKRLLELLGTDEVCINDRDFMLRLQEKIAEEYQKQEEQKLKHLREQEKKRERKLILEGIVERKCKDISSRKEKNSSEEHNEFISFEDRSFDSRPNHESFRLKEKMKSELENDETSQEHQMDGDAEDKGSGEEGTPRSEASSPSPEEEMEGERRGNEESSEGRIYHSCSFLNRPYSARMDALIKEENYQAMLEIAVDLIRS